MALSLSPWRSSLRAGNYIPSASLRRSKPSSVWTPQRESKLNKGVRFSEVHSLKTAITRKTSSPTSKGLSIVLPKAFPENFSPEVVLSRFGLTFGVLSRCVADACSCSGIEECGCFCTAVSAYAHQCAQKGILIRWRHQELCRELQR